MKKFIHKTPYAGHLISGFSLIEMMISITIGLLIVSALVGVLASNSSSSKTNNRTAELQSNGRYAANHLRSELRHSDYRGYTWDTPTPPSTSVAINNECLVAGAAAQSFVSNLSQGVWGANDSNPYAANCLSSGYSRGDVLVIRHVGGAALTAPTALASGSLYFRSTFIKGEMFKAGVGAAAVTGTPSVIGTPLADFLVQEYVYYIGSGDCLGGGTATIPALCRLALSGGAMVKELVIGGIEQMQVQYGRTPIGANTTRYYNANQITTATDWEDVSSIRIWLLSRNSQAETGYTNSATYSMGDVNYGPMNDNFRRQLFTTVVQSRNFHTE